jgi:hypothetical protein
VIRGGGAINASAAEASGKLALFSPLKSDDHGVPQFV